MIIFFQKNGFRRTIEKTSCKHIHHSAFIILHSHHLPHHAHPSLEVDLYEVCAGGIGREVDFGQRGAVARLYTCPLPFHHKFYRRTPNRRTHVRDVQPCGEVADGKLGAAGGGGLQEEQLTGFVGDGHHADGQPLGTLDDHAVGGGVGIEPDLRQPLVILRHRRGIHRVRLQDGRVGTVGDDGVTVLVIVEVEGEVVAEGQVFRSCHIAQDMTLRVKYNTMS